MYIKTAITIFIIVLAATGGGIYYWFSSASNEPVKTKSESITQIKDNQLGIAFSLPATYQQRDDTPATVGQKNAKPAKNFEQVSPQGLFTVRYESGLALAANAARMPLIDYIQSNIEQFFPGRYKDYKSISLSRTKVAGYDSIDHSYSYSDQDGNKVIARLVVVPNGNDLAYYLILQASEGNYDAVKDDMTGIKSSFKIL